MRRRIVVVLMLMLVLLPTAIAAQPVALGVGAGFVVPPPEPDETRPPVFAWGFHVSIPIITTLHLAPSSEIFRTESGYAADNALAFKFMIPLRGASLYFGVAPGLTAAGTAVSPNVSALGGVTAPLVSNVGAYLQYAYKVVFRNATNTRFSHVTAGLLFSF